MINNLDWYHMCLNQISPANGRPPKPYVRRSASIAAALRARFSEAAPRRL